MNYKKLVGFLFSTLLCINLYSAIKNFQCPKTSIPEAAKGTYEFDQYGHFIYISPERELYDILSNIETEKLGIKITYVTAKNDEYTFLPTDFSAFDNSGNIYFQISLSYTKNNKRINGIGVLKFNPQTKKTSCLFAVGSAYSLSLCVSDDGSYVFYSYHIFENTKDYSGYSYAYVIPTENPNQAEILWKPSYDHPRLNEIKNFCFDSNIQAVYFWVDGFNHNREDGNGDGFYRLKADSNGAFKASNTEQISYLTNDAWRLLIKKSEKLNDYTYLLKALKNYCGAFINPDDLEINLSYFKDISKKFNNGEVYSALYKTDSKKNSLKEEQALMHLLQNKNLFTSFISTYNSAYKRNKKAFPLDTICFYKGTDKPAFNYNAYKTFFDTYGSSRPGFLYSNKDGLWGLCQSEFEDASLIFHMTDNKGKLLGTQENGLDLARIQSSALTPRPFFANETSLTWLDINKKIIYRYEKNSLKVLESRTENEPEYTFTEVTEIANKPKEKKTVVEQVSSQPKERVAENTIVDNALINEINSRLQSSQDTINTLLFNQEEKYKSQYENFYKSQLDTLTNEKASLQTELDNLKNENIILQTELDSVISDYQENSHRNQLFFILFVILLAASIILLIILLANFTIHNRKLNEIKNNKKFIFDIQEAERAKISRDIHDSVIQDIRSIRIDAELLNPTDETKSRKDQIITTATQCVVKLRNICYNLTPAELMTHEQGDSSKIELISIIQSLVLQFIEKTHVPCQLKIDENFEYPIFSKEISQNLFRIIQESLNNIEKHSYATNCQILIKNKIENEKKYMLIYVSDDGIGCNIEQILKRHKKDHFGIQNMMDRAELIGASISFQSEQGQGMEIRIQI